MQLLEKQLMQDSIDLDLYAKFMDPQYRHAPVDQGKVGYMAKHSNFALLAGEDTVHYSIPGNIKDSRTNWQSLERRRLICYVKEVLYQFLIGHFATISSNHISNM